MDKDNKQKQDLTPQGRIQVCPSTISIKNPPTQNINQDYWKQLNKEQLSKIGALFLDDIALTDFPSLPNNTMVFIRISNSKIKTIKQTIPISLKWIDLSNNPITTLPSHITNLANLEKLLLINNNLENLPNDFSKLTSLKFLNVSGNNNLEQLPNLPTSLEHLSIGDTKITKLPYNIAQLTKLKIINATKKQASLFHEKLIDVVLNSKSRSITVRVVKGKGMDTQQD